MYMLARIIFFICFCLTVAATAEERKLSVADLGWLTGCWEERTKEFVRDEYWSQPAGGTMLGVSRTVANGKTVEYEYMRIHQEADGLYFTAQPFGRPPTSFKLQSLNNKTAIFENPASDFPRRVIYELKAKTVLKARIEGIIEGKAESMDFSFKRTACDKPAAKEVANVH